MIEPSEPQRAAAESAQPNLLVIAPPGCGKTELLALRALELIPRLGANQRILALTFTNRAKANLEERLKRVLGRDRFRRYVSVRNFHGHAAEIVRAHGSTLGLPVDDLVMPASTTLKKALDRATADPALQRAATEALAVAKRRPLSDEDLIETLSGPGAELARSVEADRILANELHYEDLLRHAQRLLAIDEVANLYRRHYGALLVDEFQDLSPQQLEIALASCDASRTFVGDPSQGIYSWAGAEPIAVEAQLREMCGEPVPLTVSFRSSPSVLSVVNGVAGRLGAALLEAADPAEWPGGGAAAVVSLPTLAEEASFISNLCLRILGADPHATVGVISRSGWRRADIDRSFAAISDVPCRRWDLAVEDPDILDRLRDAISAMPTRISVESACARVVATVEPSDVDTIEQINEAFKQLQIAGAVGVREALSELRPRVTDAPIEPGVHLLNAHTGKGQQFDWVFIPGLEEKHLPDRRSMSGEALAEEQRVLLVMLSRAKHGVVVTSVGTQVGMYGPYRSTPSRWLAGLQADATMDLKALITHLDVHYPVP